MHLYGIFGVGGFGREVIPLARETIHHQHPDGNYRLVFIDDNLDPAIRPAQHEILTPDDFFALPATRRYFNIAIAGFSTRKRIAEFMLQRGATPFSIQAANAVRLDNNTIGEGAIFCSFTTVTSNATIGKFFHANIYSYVAHDCQIGDYVTFAPNVHCNGNVIIEDHVYAGTGVVIREGTPERPLVIGKGAILGMGAIVTKSVPAYATVVGNPAKPLASRPIQAPVNEQP